MLPRDLKPAQFSAYPPQARALVVSHIETLRELPLSLVPSILRALIEYDYRFPAERALNDHELKVLSTLTAAERNEWLRGFEEIKLSAQLEAFDWVNEPTQFVEMQSAYLWTTHQLDAFRKAATDYGARQQGAMDPRPMAQPRLGIAVIGKGVNVYEGKLFRNLQAHGTRFTQVRPDDGLEQLLETVEKRAAEAPEAYGHWYVDGGMAERQTKGLTNVSYDGVARVRKAMLKFMDSEIKTPGMGPERLRTDMAKLTPDKLGVASTGDAVMDRFELKILTEGSGTQIFSTTFAQWTTREALRRAEPLTMLVRYAPRQRQRPMNELISNSGKDEQLDPQGSLVDADMGAWYHWVNQQRLAGFDKSVFVAWFEGHGEAMVIAPTLPRGATSTSSVDMSGLLKLALT